MQRFIATLLVVASLCLPSDEVFADGWPNVRGPAFDGHSPETGIIDSWPEEGPPVLWVRDLGQGYSAFVAREQRIFTQAQDLTGQYVYCLDADSGDTIWTYRYEWPYEAAGVYPGPRSTPTLYQGRLYFTSPSGRLGCLDQAGGRLIWSIDLEDLYGIRGCGFGYSCSPTLVDDLVIVPVGGKDAGVVAFECDTGKEVWKSTDEQASYTPAYPIDFNGEKLVVCYLRNALIILDRLTGKLRCRMRLSSGYDEHSCWPIFVDSKLWLSAPFKAGSYALDLSALGDDQAELPTVWKNENLSNDICSSVVVDGYVYGFDLREAQAKTHRPSRGVFQCVDVHSGEVKWSNGTGRRRRDSNADEFLHDIGQCGIIAADGKLIIFNELGDLILLRSDPTQCVELARCSVLSGELVWTPPCLHRGQVFIRNQSQAMGLYLGEPKQLGTRKFLRVADVPQSDYQNLAAAILVVEPTYMFDVPHDEWLWNWFIVGLVIVCVVNILSSLLAGRVVSAVYRAELELFGLLVVGAIGTTVMGHLANEFVFTWFVCLFAAMNYVVVRSVEPEPGARSNKPALPKSAVNVGWRQAVWRRIPMLVFLVINLLYFYACRRLSLVFEWAFGIGYFGAIPVLWLSRGLHRKDKPFGVLKLLTLVLAYCCFYGTVILFLKLRY